jgi:hypothetical protein
MPQELLIVEQLHVFEQPQNHVFVHVNHLLLQSYFVNDCFSQQLIHICSACE